jgi:hypothetical protein
MMFIEIHMKKKFHPLLHILPVGAVGQITIEVAQVVPPRAPMRWDTQSGRAHPQMQEGGGSFRDSRCAVATGIDREVGFTRAP